jgi:hypothetical protein
LCFAVNVTASEAPHRCDEANGSPNHCFIPFDTDRAILRFDAQVRWHNSGESFTLPPLNF